MPPERDPESPEAAVRAARDRFITGFDRRCASLRALLAGVRAGDLSASVAAREVCHSMAGLAGMVGFPSVSREARALEDRLLADSMPGDDGNEAHRAISAIESAFAADLAAAAADWTSSGEAERRPPHSADLAPRVTILVVEDDEDMLHILEAALRTEGYRTIAATDGRKAVTAIEMITPELIVLDLSMPRFSGFDVLTHVRTGHARHVKVMVVSALGREEDVRRALALGADDYLTKPFKQPELLERVRRLLAK